MTDDKKIPGFKGYDEMAEFWDTHDLADYWDQTEPAEFEILPDARRPYKDWKRIRPTMKKKETDFDPDEYKGIYKNLDLNWDEEIKNLRDEWEREII